MSATNSGTSARWRQHMTILGIDPDRDLGKGPIRKRTTDLAEYKKWWNFPPCPDTRVASLTVDAVAAMSEEQLHATVMNHVANLRVVEDAAIIAAIEKKAGSFTLDVLAVEEQTIDEPLIVTSPTLLEATNITMADGAYIKASATLTLSCDTFTRLGSSGMKFDVFCTGEDGADGDGPEPDPAVKGKDGRKGRDAKCSAFSPNGIRRKSSDGSDGGAGHDGGKPSDGEPGGDGPVVAFTVSTSLQGLLSFLNRGGMGGDGAQGGTGGEGGKGGKGGDGADCLKSVTGGHGGRGGNGGVGGNGSNGGDGGAGGMLTLQFPVDAVDKHYVSWSNAQAPGGDKGDRGFGGVGGAGGKGGSNGGGNGAPGHDGGPGIPGERAGNPGALGIIYVNGVPAI